MSQAAGVTAYIGLGANLGDAPRTLLLACEALSGLPESRWLGCSSLYRSAPIDAAGPDFFNAVVALQTALPAEALLDALQAVENQLGRERPYRHAPRTLDLDLLLYGDACITTPRLTVPHPRLQERAFVLRPLQELQPGLRLPGLGPLTPWLVCTEGQQVAMVGPLTLAGIDKG